MNLARTLPHFRCRYTPSRFPQVQTRARSYKPSPSQHARKPQTRPRAHDDATFDANAVLVSPRELPQLFNRKVKEWMSIPANIDRLLRFGIPSTNLPTVLKLYQAELKKGTVFPALSYSEQHLSRMARELTSRTRLPIDVQLTKVLFEWASLPEGQRILAEHVPPAVLAHMKALFHAADLTSTAWEYPYVRVARPRKIIMHVGPTNSGKTHNALRALAAAKRGMYAGPLRLLAYEIWDRLNTGQIVPLGMDAGPDAEADTESTIDVAKGAVVKRGNPRFARQCNMLTGEEQKIVSHDAPLLSCTVEMTPFVLMWDVAVIDEIQMITDKDRGGAWTAALLGVNAAEVHLCGEESAVPLVEAMVKELGDTIEIQRYERLSPLVVAEKSLKNNLGQVKKGDCVVAFSRSGIFNLKEQIEKKTKLRCALAYGRLPPEIRNEQAALFNDPNTDYDVLVGSDAIGMGLNLKIKRIIFHTTSKFDGREEKVLSSSQIKQIAGRAGRFGLHGSTDTVGVVTTLEEKDLPVVRKALAAPFKKLEYARLAPSIISLSRLALALPQDSSHATISDVYMFLSKVSPLYEFQAVLEEANGPKFIDNFADCLTIANKLLVQGAPIAWRDILTVSATQAMMEIFRDKLRVPLEEVLLRANLLKPLNDALVLMEEGRYPKAAMDMLAKLESVHKVVVLYLWFSYRLVAAFPDQHTAFELRQLTELVMDWCLEVIHHQRMKVADPAAKARDMVLARRPVQEVDVAVAKRGGFSELAPREVTRSLFDANGQLTSPIFR